MIYEGTRGKDVAFSGYPWLSISFPILEGVDKEIENEIRPPPYDCFFEIPEDAP